MARDPLLKDALGAIKDKIKTAAGTASPEELAYLGTAIDRIGGRATVLEVEEMGDIKIEEITTHADLVQSQTYTNIAAMQNDAETHILNIKSTSKSYMDAEKAALFAEVDAYVTNALSVASNAMNGVTQQFVFGAKSYFFSQLQ